LSTVRVTGSAPIANADITGLGGTLVIHSGGKIFISGAAGGGGGSNTSVTGSSAITAPNFTGAGSVTLTYDGTYVRVSGTVSSDTLLSGYLEGNFVHRGAVDEIISGVKYFTGNPQIPAPVLPSGAANLSWVSGVSGVLIAQMTGMSGVLAANGGVVNTYYITGTGTINNTYNSSGGAISNTFNDYEVTQLTITGNFNIASFFLDPVITGLNIAESFVGGMGYFFTGAAFSCRTSGSGPVNGGIMSGKLYQVDSNNTEQTLYAFTFNSGIVYSGSPSFNLYVTGRNRIGLSLTNGLSGIQKLCVGVFGGTYV
jgi:hypothetical protein